MGMAASQARLLTITARMHDVEYAAQSIQNAKIVLANQSDEVYKDYIEALDATTLTVRTVDGNVVPANFRNLCGINAIKALPGNKRFALRDERGRLIIDDEILEDYRDFKKNYGSDDPYKFAVYMLTGGDYEPSGSDDAIDKAKEEIRKGNTALVDEDLQKALKQFYIDVYGESDGVDKYNEAVNNHNNDHTDEDIIEFLEDCGSSYEEGWISVEECLNSGDSEKIKAAQKYLDCKTSLDYKLFKSSSEEIFKAAGLDERDYNYDDFWYYVNMFKQIESAGGADYCTPISEFNGLDGIGDAANDGDWLQNMIQSGRITIDISEIDKNGKIGFTSTGVSNDSQLEYTTTTTIDKAAYAKAEAEYEHKVKEINKKDKRYDMELTKLETEREALKTEYDSVKKVIQENIERTFGIFS